MVVTPRCMCLQRYVLNFELKSAFFIHHLRASSLILKPSRKANVNQTMKNNNKPQPWHFLCPFNSHQWSHRIWRFYLLESIFFYFTVRLKYSYYVSRESETCGNVRWLKISIVLNKFINLVIVMTRTALLSVGCS